MSQSQIVPDSNNGGSSPPTGKPAVGYKRPPVHTRFAKGRSGNLKGRPAGTPNVADILKKLFNKKVSVREGNRTRSMNTCEAIIRLAVAKARSGNAPALTTVFTILDKLGATKDVTSEERQKRTIKFVRPHGRDDYDLLYAPAREKERQHCCAIAERNETIAEETTACLIRTGDELTAQGKADEALAAYCQQIALCTNQLAESANDHAASSEHRRAVARIGLLADQLVFCGNFAAALKSADEAIVRSGAETSLTWIQLIRAHANMFLGRTIEARDFYLSFRSDKNVTFTSWETLILRDFRRLQRAGHSYPLMVEVEKRLADAGWTAQGRRTDKTATPAINADDEQFIMLNPDHVQTGALLSEQGKLDEAADVYWRNLTKCQTRPAKEPLHAETTQLLDLLVVRLGVLAADFVHRGRFATALGHAQGLIAVAPEHYGFHATRAHAMMFIGREDEAEKLYLHYRGQKIGDDLWESAVVANFNKYRQAGRSHPLMDKVERLFERKDWFQPPDNASAKASVGIAETAPHQADDIPSGDRLIEEGKFDEALDVYRRRIEISQAKLANGRVNLQALEDRQIAIERISDLAFVSVLNRDFQKAYDIADGAIRILPNATWPNLRRAHAMMF